MFSNEETTRIIPYGQEDHEGIVGANIRYRLTTNGVLLRLGDTDRGIAKWDARLMYIKAADGKRSVAMMTHCRPTNPDEIEIMENTCLPSIWPRTWMQGYIAGVVDISVFLTVVLVSDLPPYCFMGLMLFSGYMSMRLVAYCEWKDDQPLATAFNTSDNEEVLTCGCYGATDGSLGFLQSSEIEISTDTWPVFSWPVKAYFAGVLETWACGWAAYTILGSRMSFLGLLWALERIIHEHATEKQHQAYVKQIFS